MQTVQTLEVPGSSITTAIQTTSGKSIHGGESEFALASKTNELPVVLNDNIYFTEPKMVASTINETNEMNGNKSLLVHITMSTTNTKLCFLTLLNIMNLFLNYLIQDLWLKKIFLKNEIY